MAVLLFQWADTQTIVHWLTLTPKYILAHCNTDGLQLCARLCQSSCPSS